MDRGGRKATVQEVAKSRTWLNDFTFTFPFQNKYGLVFQTSFFPHQIIPTKLTESDYIY